MSVNFNPLYSAGQAKDYYKQGDYFEQEMVGQWLGSLAERFGLTGTVNKNIHDLLCDNKRPDGSALTPRTVTGRMIGMDITFNAPKSLSLLYQHTKDEKVLDVFRRCVQETVLEMEQNVYARVTRNGKKTIESTGNLVAAEYIHFTGRPVDGYPDPHLHSHIVVYNATHFEGADRVQSAYFGKLQRNVSEAKFHARLSHAVQHELGYRVELDGKGFWRVAGVPLSLERKFSRRTDEVNNRAKELGLEGNKDAIALLAKTTRSKKDRNLTIQECHDMWDGLKSDVEKRAMDHLREIPLRYDIDGKSAVSFALEHELQNASTVKKDHWLVTSLKRAFGSASLTDVERSLEQKGGDILSGEKDGATHFTTKDVLGEEQYLIQWARNTKGVCNPIFTGEYQIKDIRLDKDQRGAVQHVLKSSDKVTYICGDAGTGKTTALQELQRGIQEAGKEVVAIAPTNAAVDVLKEDGFKDAFTIARLLTDPRAQEAIRDKVLFIDEAGMVSVPAMTKIVHTMVHKNVARMVLVGDEKQHASPERGDAIRLLRERAAVEPVRITKIWRQEKEGLKHCISKIAAGEVEQGVKLLDELGAIKEIGGPERLALAAHDYVAQLDAWKVSGTKRQGREKQALVVSPTHAEGKKVTGLIREGLKESKVNPLGKKDYSVMQLKNLNFSDAQKADAHLYKPGMIVELHENAGGTRINNVLMDAGRLISSQLKHMGERLDRRGGQEPKRKVGRPSVPRYVQRKLDKGTRIEVVGIDDAGHVYGTLADGSTCLVPTWDSRKFAVMETREIPIAKGEKIRVTKGGQTKDGHRLNNGAILKVKRVCRNGDIETDRGWILDKEHGHLTHGYVTTSHSSQGRTVDAVFLCQGTASGRAASREQLYVSCSRAREKVKIYTDNKEVMLEQVLGSSARMSATELLYQKDLPQQQIRKQAAFLRQYIHNAAVAIGKPIKDVSQKVKQSILETAQSAGISPSLVEQAISAATGKSWVERVALEGYGPSGSQSFQNAALARANEPQNESAPRFTEKIKQAAIRRAREHELENEMRADRSNGKEHRFTDHILSRNPEVRAAQLMAREEKQQKSKQKILDRLAVRFESRR